MLVGLQLDLSVPAQDNFINLAYDNISIVHHRNLSLRENGAPDTLQGVLYLEML